MSGASRQMVRVHIDDDVLEYAVDSERWWGDDADPLAEDDDLTAGAPWTGDGFVVAPFVPTDEFEQLRRRITALVAALVGDVPHAFSLEHYHRYVDAELHTAVVSVLSRGFTMDRFPIDLAVVEQRMSELCGISVISRHPVIEPGIWSIRLVRPNRATDHNPPHRDQWIDHLRSGLNLYAPLAGSTARSSLPLVPGSHHRPESTYEHTGVGPTVDGVRFYVPALAGADEPVRLTRPNPPLGQCLVFSPYLLHGGGINLESDTTRVSLEMRFWRDPDRDHR